MVLEMRGSSIAARTIRSVLKNSFDVMSVHVSVSSAKLSLTFNPHSSLLWVIIREQLEWLHIHGMPKTTFRAILYCSSAMTPACSVYGHLKSINVLTLSLPWSYDTDHDR